MKTPDFRVGDSVMTLANGHGTVAYVREKQERSIIVKFPNGEMSIERTFLPNGKYKDTDLCRTLFHCADGEGAIHVDEVKPSRPIERHIVCVRMKISDVADDSLNTYTYGNKKDAEDCIKEWKKCSEYVNHSYKVISV